MKGFFLNGSIRSPGVLVRVEEEVGPLTSWIGLNTRHETLQRLCYRSSHVIRSLPPSVEVYILPRWSLGNDCGNSGRINQTVAIDRPLLVE